MLDAWRWDIENFPLSFRYGGKFSRELLPAWKKTLTDKEGKNFLTFTDSATNMVLTATVREFPDSPAREWVVEFENQGNRDTPILEEIFPLDLAVPVSDREPAVLHHAKGSLCLMDDFQPLITPLPPQEHFTLAPLGGRSSNGELPFMNLQLPGEGLVLAIGWSGQWAATFDRSQTAIRITAGMERTHLRLHPGEKIRTPRILLIPWTGTDPILGNNLLRRIILKHYTPTLQGENILPPIAHMTMSTYHFTQVVSEDREMKALARAAELGAEAYWIDACWYGKSKDWSKEVGTWKVNPRHFPNGLKPIGDAAHAKGMKFVVWFEPERARYDSEIETDHPEFLLRCIENRDSCLLNLGLPEARKFITDIISGYIREWGVDIYRQDFNMEPLPFWRATDAPDRIGMSEIRHIEGLYQMWDELRQRHPGLAIDNCASGGRRIDLETIARSFPLWRSDFSDAGGPSQGEKLQIGDQLQTAGLSRWVPLHTAAVWYFTPYAFHSAMSTGVVPYCNITEVKFPFEQARKALAELKRLRPYFVGDFYPLRQLTTSSEDWCAYQFDRPDMGEGFAVYLRRPESPFDSMEAWLKGIDPNAEYRAGISYNFEEPERKKISGADLIRLGITIRKKPGSAILLYSR